MFTRLFTVFLLILAFETSAQDAENITQSTNPIEDEFNELINSSNNYQGFKVVDYNAIIELRDLTSAHITELDNEIITQRNTIELQQQEIAQLQNELDLIKEDLEKVTADKDAITFLGMPFSKSSYKTLMWAIVAILIIALVFFIIRFKKGHAQTSEAKRNLSEIEKEFDAYRVKALEKEQRLGRLLQDERNKSSDN